MIIPWSNMHKIKNTKTNKIEFNRDTKKLNIFNN